MTAKAAQWLLTFPTPDHDQISTLSSRFAGDTLRYSLVADYERKVGPGSALEFGYFDPCRFGQIAVQVEVKILVRPRLHFRNAMNQADLGAEVLRQFPCETQQRNCFVGKFQCTDDIREAGVRAAVAQVRERVGPHGTTDIVQHLGCH